MCTCNPGFLPEKKRSRFFVLLSEESLRESELTDRPKLSKPVTYRSEHRYGSLQGTLSTFECPPGAIPRSFAYVDAVIHFST